MKLGIISDVHANFEALQATYSRLTEEGCDEIISLGDVVGYGPSPVECIEFLQKHSIESLMGNHDYYVIDTRDKWRIKDYAQDAILWTRKQLSDVHFDYLRNNEISMIKHDITFVHSSLDDSAKEPKWPYILDSSSAERHLFLQTTQVGFFGHVHIPLLSIRRPDSSMTLEFLHSAIIDENEEYKYLLNAGSVGQPRDADDRACAVVYDTSARLVELLRIPYDYRTTQAKIIDAGLPELLADRLATGK